MVSSISPQELVLVIAANDFSPAVVNFEFLKYSGVIGADWELARAPIYNNQVTQLAFQNGVVITAQSGRIILAENLAEKDASHSLIGDVAHKFVQSLPNLEYSAVGINPTGHAAFEGGRDSVKQFLSGTLVAPGPWQNIGIEAPRATLNFTYRLERGALNLTVSEAGLRADDETITPVVVFSGNFSYPVSGGAAAERVNCVCDYLNHWRSDLTEFQKIVDESFLSQVDSASEPAQTAPTLIPAFA